MKKKIIPIFLLCFGIQAFSQWTKISNDEIKVKSSENLSLYQLDLEKIRTQLGQLQKGKKEILLQIPTLKGDLQNFRVYSAPVMAPELEKEYQLGSYVGIGEDGSYARFSASPYNFQAMIYHHGKYEFIEALKEKKSVYKVFPKSKSAQGERAFQCLMTEPEMTKQQLDRLYQNQHFSYNPSNFSKTGTPKYRTYRIAISVTGEYTQHFGGKALAIAAINNTMTRVNGIYERDLGIHLVVQNFPQLIYEDPDTDPYSDGDKGVSPDVSSNGIPLWTIELQNNLTQTIGHDAYDLGHLFGASGGGGYAGGVGVVCTNPAINERSYETKGAAFTSPGAGGTPSGDSFDIDYVAHEIGHQLGADHTFSHTIHQRSNKPIDTHMEPGSGSSIMGYAGITSSNVQSQSDAYFLHKSIEQIEAYTQAQNCGTSQNITTQAPVITPFVDRVIPKSTAFVLSAEVSNPMNLPLTYSWDQYDSAITPITDVTQNLTHGAKFRSVKPSSSKERFFPKLENVLQGKLSDKDSWEAVSNVAREMNFKFTVRDNNPNVNQQQVAMQGVKITVGEHGPFEILGGGIFYNNLSNEILWQVASTNEFPYSVPNVQIDYTKDNGQSWQILKNSTENDGKEILENQNFSEGEKIFIRIKAIDNVFYAVKSFVVKKAKDFDSSAPVGLTFQPNVKTCLISFDLIKGASHYILKYREKGSQEWKEIQIEKSGYLLEGLLSHTTYEVQLAGVSPSAGVGNFTDISEFQTQEVTFCTPKVTNSTDGYIANVSIKDRKGNFVINHSSEGQKYIDYTTDTSKVITLEQGTKNTFTLTKKWGKGTKYKEGVRAWIDFNEDGNFDNQEIIFSSSPNMEEVVSGEFSVPNEVVVGRNLRMRVALLYNVLPTNPCGIYPYGEVEDYAVNIFKNLSVSEASINEDSVQIYPNPASDKIQIQKIKTGEFIIYDFSGQKIKEGKINQNTISVMDLEKGIYILEIKTKDKNYKTKFIKK